MITFFYEDYLLFLPFLSITSWIYLNATQIMPFALIRQPFKKGLVFLATNWRLHVNVSL